MYIEALREIFLSSINLAFLVADSLFFILGLLSESASLQSHIYLGILIAGFLVSAIKCLAEKNVQISALKSSGPAVVPYLKVIGHKRRFRIRNLWSEPIRNVRIGPLKVTDSNEKKVIEHRFQMEGTDVLKSGEERTLSNEVLSDGVRLDESLFDDFLAVIDPKYATASFVVSVSFEDFRGVSYETVWGLGQGGLRVCSVSKVT